MKWAVILLVALLMSASVIDARRSEKRQKPSVLEEKSKGLAGAVKAAAVQAKENAKEKKAEKIDLDSKKIVEEEEHKKEELKKEELKKEELKKAEDMRIASDRKRTEERKAEAKAEQAKQIEEVLRVAKQTREDEARTVAEAAKSGPAKDVEILESIAELVGKKLALKKAMEDANATEAKALKAEIGEIDLELVHAMAPIQAMKANYTNLQSSHAALSEANANLTLQVKILTAELGVGKVLLKAAQDKAEECDNVIVKEVDEKVKSSVQQLELARIRAEQAKKENCDTNECHERVAVEMQKQLLDFEQQQAFLGMVEEIVNQMDNMVPVEVVREILKRQSVNTHELAVNLVREIAKVVRHHREKSHGHPDLAKLHDEEESSDDEEEVVRHHEPLEIDGKQKEQVAEKIRKAAEDHPLVAAKVKEGIQHRKESKEEVSEEKIRAAKEVKKHSQPKNETRPELLTKAKEIRKEAQESRPAVVAKAVEAKSVEAKEASMVTLSKPSAEPAVVQQRTIARANIAATVRPSQSRFMSAARRQRRV